MDVDVPTERHGGPSPAAPARHPAHAAGDVIPVELPEEMIMRANGVPAFKVKMGSHKGNLALQVIEPIERRSQAP